MNIFGVDWGGLCGSEVVTQLDKLRSHVRYQLPSPPLDFWDYDTQVTNFGVLLGWHRPLRRDRCHAMRAKVTNFVCGESNC